MRPQTLSGTRPAPTTGAEPHQPLVSVVISAKNRPECIERLLASVRRQDLTDLEVVIVDDGSSPPLAPKDPGIRLLRNETSQGMCAARNRAWRAARGRFLVYLDDDAELVSSHTLRRAIARLESVPRCAVLGFRQLSPDGSPHYMQPATLASGPSLTNRFYGYGFLFVRSVMEELGGFAEPYGYYQEEVQVSLRLLAHGYRIAFDPEVAVIHHQDLRGRDPKKISKLLLRNGLLTVLLT
ncbi:MAG: glycosyltransferase, partial [Myxococcaceae bacterium]|nr:glycosyltransferase [Myxococcaceae bacterium]